MGVLNHPIPDQLDIHEKVIEKVGMDSESTNYSCPAMHHNIESTPPQLDNTQRLSRMMDEIP